MNVKELRAFLDREESLWTDEQREFLGDFELTPVVIDTLTCYSEMEGMYLGEISTLVLYPCEAVDKSPYGHHNYLSSSAAFDEAGRGYVTQD